MYKGRVFPILANIPWKGAYIPFHPNSCKLNNNECTDVESKKVRPVTSDQKEAPFLSDLIFP